MPTSGRACTQVRAHPEQPTTRGHRSRYLRLPAFQKMSRYYLTRSTLPTVPCNLSVPRIQGQAGPRYRIHIPRLIRLPYALRSRRLLFALTPGCVREFDRRGKHRHLRGSLRVGKAELRALILGKRLERTAQAFEGLLYLRHGEAKVVR